MGFVVLIHACLVTTPSFGDLLHYLRYNSACYHFLSSCAEYNFISAPYSHSTFTSIFKYMRSPGLPVTNARSFTACETLLRGYLLHIGTIGELH